ncbi:uncharacterized protein LOC141613628 [Silene latifolia]|uniref:uncharacterized protein LOC141613628 n=1 Tax=Silene latifolia TaxID=37657 RepID=UPI003D776A6F
MECTRTASYSLVLNGETFGHFKGAQGLRQGDPLSPLLFTIAMEYLSRILAYTTATFPFKFHPLCSPLNLSHLMFADDLLLFCKGDVKSIMVILRSFSTFSHASGLQMNPTKTNAFFNGVPTNIKHEILQISGVHEGSLPFRYLGVPITCGRMSKLDCNILVEKLITRIRSFGSKKLSYSGRLVLVSSVLTTFGMEGLTLSDVLDWGWKSVCRIKDKLAAGYSNGHWVLDTKGYTVQSGYDLLRQKFQTVSWHKQVWNPWCIPKHQFIAWLVAREALLLKERLLSLGIAVDADCLLCGKGIENHVHLFQTCEYARKIYTELGTLLDVALPATDLISLIGSGQHSKLKKGILLCAVIAAQYHIWIQRNQARVADCILRPNLVVSQIMKLLRMRVSSRLQPNLVNLDVMWLSSVKLRL